MIDGILNAALRSCAAAGPRSARWDRRRLT
jgi:hypothetical protein